MGCRRELEGQREEEAALEREHRRRLEACLWMAE